MHRRSFLKGSALAAGAAYTMPSVALANSMSGGALSPTAVLFTNPEPLGQATLSTLPGGGCAVGNCGSSGNDGVRLNTTSSEAAAILAQGCTVCTDEIDLGDPGNSFTYDACDFFDSVQPSMRLGCTNILGNITLIFDMNVAPILCTTVTIYLRDATSGTYTTRTATAGNLAEVLTSTTIVGVGVDISSAPAAGLQVLLSTPATFGVGSTGSGFGSNVTNVDQLVLAPSGCSITPVLEEVVCCDLRMAFASGGTFNAPGGSIP